MERQNAESFIVENLSIQEAIENVGDLSINVIYKIIHGYSNYE